jgi:hypothetical protein
MPLATYASATAADNAAVSMGILTTKHTNKDPYGARGHAASVGDEFPVCRDRMTLGQLKNAHSSERKALENDVDPKHNFPGPLLRDVQQETADRNAGKRRCE